MHLKTFSYPKLAKTIQCLKLNKKIENSLASLQKIAGKVKN